VVNEIRATNHDISYQIVYFGGEKKIWFAERELLSPAPVLKVPQCVADWYEKYKCALAGKTEVIYDFDNSGFVYFESDRKILKEDFKEITDVEYIKRNLECAIWKKEREGK
ncbi:TPA: hypothetical protein RF330_001539, partial [Listeria monocytogenes]|nr:hypothetical protein [Listeria monocytogenes]